MPGEIRPPAPALRAGRAADARLWEKMFIVPVTRANAGAATAIGALSMSAVPQPVEQALAREVQSRSTAST
jgi:hypothetical protein